MKQEPVRVVAGLFWIEFGPQFVARYGEYRICRRSESRMVDRVDKCDLWSEGLLHPPGQGCD